MIFAIGIPVIILISLIVILNRRAFLNKISKYEVGDIIKFGDKVYDDDRWCWRKVKEGTIKSWSDNHFIAISQGKEYYKEWKYLQKNISYEDRLTKQYELSIKEECNNYMSRNKNKTDVTDLDNEINFK